MSNFADLLESFKEVEEPNECEVKGSIPGWLSVNLLRNGPGMFRVGNDSYNHWFDGLSFMQRYHFNNKKMFYSAKYLKSDTYKKNMESERITVTEFGTRRYPDPCKTLFKNYFTHIEDKLSTDNALINYVQSGDAIFAVTETPHLRRVDADTLETLGKVNLRDYVAVNSCTAHQHSTEEGAVLNIGTRYARDSFYVFVKTDSPSNAHKNDDEAFENTKVVGEIPITDPMYPGYYHSFGMTKNFMILFELPLRINVMTLSANATRPVCLTDAFEWHDKPTRIHVFNWHNGENVPIVFDYDPCFIFHHANAYEKDGCLVVDFNKMVTADILNTLDVNRMRANGFHTKSDKERGYLHRVIIPLSIPSGAKPASDLLQNISFAGKCKAVVGEDGKSVRLVDERLSPETFEFPRYNYAYNAKPYRYCYGATIQPHDDSLTGLVKCDLEKKSTSTWNRDHAEQVCAEPVFVAKPDAKSEDDGVILCPILTTRKNERSFVLVLDGSTFKEIARCHVEQPLPLSFHSMCFSNKSK